MKQPRLLPSAADLDRIAEEDEIRQRTHTTIERKRTTYRLDRRAQAVLDEHVSANLCSENAAINFLLKEYARLRDELDTRKKK